MNVTAFSLIVASLVVAWAILFGLPRVLQWRRLQLPARAREDQWGD